jgi:DNA-binding MarR family transcriptional regulator
VERRPDPTEVNRWRPLRLLLDAMEADIARLYAEHGISGIRPRHVGPLIRLGRRGPMSIRELADALTVTHSAMSQTVSALRREGLVRDVPGDDARVRRVALTERARAVLPFLEAEWSATERAVAELEDEIPYPLSRVIRDLEAALARRSFRDRIARHLP